MANDAQKKKDRQLQSTRTLYNRINVGVHAAYFLWRVALHWSSFGGWLWPLWLMFAAVDVFCSNSIYASIQGGYNYSYYQDVLFVSWFSQVVCLFSDSGGYIFLLVPGYMIYKGISSLITWCMTPDMEEPELDEKTLKRMQKKERQLKRAQKFQR